MSNTLTDADYIAWAKRLMNTDQGFPVTATDKAWSAATGMCGGCGNEECHPDLLCPEIKTWHGLVCGACHHRHDQGLHRRDCQCKETS